MHVYDVARRCRRSSGPDGGHVLVDNGDSRNSAGIDRCWRVLMIDFDFRASLVTKSEVKRVDTDYFSEE